MSVIDPTIRKPISDFRRSILLMSDAVGLQSATRTLMRLLTPRTVTRPSGSTSSIKAPNLATWYTLPNCFLA